MRPCLSLALFLLLGSSAEARRFQQAPPPSASSVIEQSFRGTPTFRLELARVPGDLHRLGGPDPRWLDFADYSDAGTLRAHRALALGPLSGGPALIPPGDYALSLSVSGPEGLPVLGLVSTDGLRLRIPMVSAPRPAQRPQGLTAVSLANGQEATVSVPLAIHLPTASGLLLIGPLETLEESPLRRRQSRTDVIRQEMERRALETGHVRNLERRKAR